MDEPNFLEPNLPEPNRSVAKRQVARLLGSATHPMYVVSEDGTLVFANDALAALVGKSSEGLLGLDCSSPVPDTEGSVANLSAFLSLPIQWSRRGLKIVTGVGLPEAMAHASAITTSDFAVGDPWVRCLIPLGEEDGCTLCVLFKEADPSALGYVDQRASVSQAIILYNQAHFPYMRDLWYLQGKSAATQKALAQVNLAVRSHFPLAIFGRVGSGRSWLAQTIHIRRVGSKPGDAKSMLGHALVRIDCSLMDIALLQSMFEAIEENLKRGASTQALLIDNLDALPSDCFGLMNSALKRLDGLPRIVTCDPDVSNELRKAEPQWDELESRTSVLRIELPRLSERLADIPTLLTAWFEQHRKAGNAVPEMGEDFLDAIYAYGWPNDVEELAQALSYATTKTTGSKLTHKDLPVNIRTCISHIEQSQVDHSMDLDAILEDVEKNIILRALERFPKNKSLAAKLLNISRARLLRRLQQWGIQSETSANEDVEDLPDFNEVT